MTLLKLILCKWLKIHWIRTSHTEYDDGSIEEEPDTYCRLCGYWPGIDDLDEYVKEEIILTPLERAGIFAVTALLAEMITVLIVLKIAGII